MDKLVGLAIIGVPITYFLYNYGKRYVSEHIMGKVQEELDRRLKEDEEKEHFKPTKGKSAIIKVSHMGKTHSVYLPYDRRKSSQMMRRKVFLIKEGEKTDISQKPGIPYLVSAQDLGGDLIQVEDLEGNVLNTFPRDKIPII